jgi:hypothetical protein
MNTKRFKKMFRKIYRFVRSLLKWTSKQDEKDTEQTDQKDEDDLVDAPVEKPDVEDPPREEHTPPDEEEDGHFHEDEGQSTEEKTEPKEEDVKPDEDVNKSSEESLDIKWPPNECVDTPHRGIGEETIEVRLYWREGDELGEWGCKMAKPYVEYCYEEAWGKDYEVNCTIHSEPVPIDRNSRDNHGTWYGAFKDYYWQLSSDNRAKHANALIGHLPGVFGEGGGHYCVVNFHKMNGPADHYPWKEDDCVRERHYGGLGHSINSVLHEIGHCLGLSHHDHEPDQDDLVEVYGKTHVTVMDNSYISGDGKIHILGERVRSKEPDLSY